MTSATEVEHNTHLFFAMSATLHSLVLAMVDTLPVEHPFTAALIARLEAFIDVAENGGELSTPEPRVAAHLRTTLQLVRDSIGEPMPPELSNH